MLVWWKIFPQWWKHCLFVFIPIFQIKVLRDTWYVTSRELRSVVSYQVLNIWILVSISPAWLVQFPIQFLAMILTDKKSSLYTLAWFYVHVTLAQIFSSISYITCQRVIMDWHPKYVINSQPLALFGYFSPTCMETKMKELSNLNGRYIEPFQIDSSRPSAAYMR